MPEENTEEEYEVFPPPAPMVQEFELLYGHEGKVLSEEVNEYLSKGWELFGSPFYGEERYHQAVMRWV